MARKLPNLALHIFSISILILSMTISAMGSCKTLGLGKEKLSHFRLYWHDVVGGRNPTSIPVMAPRLNFTTGFGCIMMIDNPLTLGPKFSSKIVGRAEGFYAFASREDTSLLMVMNFAITHSKYNGSTITVMVRNLVSIKVREMSVIGGSGHFRFAHGYVKATTLNFDPKTKDATIEYNVYVLHY